MSGSKSVGGVGSSVITAGPAAKRQADRSTRRASSTVFEVLERRRLMSVAAGNLDPSFGTTGKVTTDFAGGEDTGSAVVVEPAGTAAAGDVVVVGTSNGMFAVSTYAPDGTPLHTATTPIGSSNQAVATAAVVDPSGRVVVAGYVAGGTTLNDFVVARYAVGAGGAVTLDTGFGTGGSGYTQSDVAGAKRSDEAAAVALEPVAGGGYDVVVAGTTGAGTVTAHDAVARYTTGGVLDATFGTNGFVVTTGTADAAAAVVAGTNGTLLLAGSSGAGAEVVTVSSTYAVARHAVPLGSGSVLTSAVVNPATGEYLVAGAADGNFVVAEVTAAGGLDGSFATGGKTETAFAGDTAVANALAVQANNKIVLVGTATDGSGDAVFALSRYSSTGLADAAFGAGGSTTTDFNPGGTAASVALDGAVEPDGKVLAAGYTDAGPSPDNFAVARYVADNAPTATGNAAFTTIVQNQTTATGDTVAALLARLGAADVDGDAVALAVTGVDDAHGTFQYSTDGGATFAPIPPAGDAAAFVLTAAPGHLVRFVPAAGYSGPATLTVRVFDQTQPTTNGTADATASAAANLNAFSDATYTLTQTVAAAPAVDYVNRTWAGDAQGQQVTDSFGTHTFGIDAFATVQDGVTYVAAGGTTRVDAGTYRENVVVAHAVTLSGPNAGVAGFGTARAAEAVVQPGTGSSFDSSNVITVAASNVTIDGLTVQGSVSGTVPAGQSAGSTLAVTGVTSYAAAGVANSVDVSNLIVRNNVIRDFTQGGIVGDDTGGTVTGGNQFAGNAISDVPDNGQNGYYGQGIVAYDDFYARIQDNQLRQVRTGIETGNYASPPPTGFTPTITGNDVSAYVKGVYLNLEYAAVSATVADNTIAQADGAVAAVYNVGLLIQSIQGAATPTVSGNDVTGFEYGVELSGDVGTTPVTVQGGTLTGDRYGVWATNNDYLYGGAATTATLSGVHVVDSAVAGVWVDTTSPTSGGTLDTTDRATLSLTNGTTITGGPTGLLVSGSLAAVGGNTLADTAFVGQSGNYVALTDAALSAGTDEPAELNATAATFDGTTGAAAGLAGDYAIDDKVVDYIDVPTVGFVRINAGNVYVTAGSEATTAGAVQRGVVATADDDTVHVTAGTFVGDIDVPNPLTLQGAQVGVNPTTTASAASAQTVIEPGTVGNAVVYVGSDDVTIDGVTVDGTAAAGVTGATTTAYGATVAGGVGIASYDGVGGVTVRNDIVRHVQTDGVEFYNYSDPAATGGNTLANNVIQYVGGGGTTNGVGVLLYNNFYAAVTGNAVSDTRVGIQTGNFSQAAPAGTAPVISGNTVTAARAGIFYNLHYSAATPFAVASNVIRGFTTAESPVTKWDGIELFSQQSASPVAASNNTIDGSGSSAATKVGYEAWSDPTTGTVAVTGGTVSGVTYGVWANSYEGYSSAGSATALSVANLSITASTAGVYVEDSPQNANHPAVAVTVTGATISAPTGVLVSGANASASVTNTTVTGGTTAGLEVDAGKLRAQGDTLTGEAVGVVVTGGGVADLGDASNSNTTGLGTSTGGNDLSGYTGVNGNYAVDDRNAASQPNVLAQNDNFGKVSSSNQGFIGTVIHDHADDASLSTVIYTPAANATTQPTTVYVSGGFAGTALGADPDGTGPATAYGYDAFPDVQDAVNAVATGGTVIVETGTYAGEVDVAKNLTLRGDGSNPVLQAVAGMASQFANNGSPNTAVLYVTGATVDVSGLTVDGDGQGASYPTGFDGVAYLNAAGTVNGVTVENVSYNPLSGVQAGVGVYASDTDGAARNFTFANGTVTGYEKNGFVLKGTGLTAAVSGSTVTGAGPTGTIAQNGVEVFGGAVGTITGNTISGDTYTNVAVADSTAVLLYQAGAGTTVSGNTISDSNVGVYAYADAGTTTISANDIAGTDAAAVVSDDNATAVTGNTFHDNTGDAVDLYDGQTGTTLSGNTFTGTAGSDVDNESSADIDASNNTFDGYAPTNSNLAGQYAVEDKIVDGIDVGGLGLVNIDPGRQNLYVTPGSFDAADGTTAPSVQRAVDLAVAGQTVHVAAGTYPGQVSVDKDLTVVGSGSGTVLQAVAGMAGQFADNGQANTAVLYVSAATVDVSNLAVDGNHLGASYPTGFDGIAYVNAGGTVTGVAVRDVEYATLSGVQAGVGVIATDTDGAARTFTFAGGSVTGYQKNGFTLKGAGLTANVTGTTVTGAGPTAVIAQNGIQVSGSAVGQLTGDTVSGDSYTGSQAAVSVGILVAGAAAGTTVSGSTVSGNDVGIDVDTSAGTTTVTDTSVTGNGTAGVVSSGSAVAITRDDVSGNGDGIDLYGPQNGTSVTNTFVQNNHAANGKGNGIGIYVADGVTDSAAPLHLNADDIAGNDYGLFSPGGVTVDATDDYWGAADGPAAYSADGNTQLLTGDGDTAFGDHTTYTPFLTDGTDADHTRGDGFQPVTAGNLGVDIAGPSTVDEGATYTLQLDPSSPGNAAVTGYDVNFGDGTPVVHVNGNPATVTHVYADGPNSYTITATATTTSGTATTNSVAVTVNDVAPTTSLAVDSNPGLEGGAISVTASATDPGSTDTAAGFTYHYTVTETHGSTTTTVADFTTGAEATAPYTFTPTDDGTYVVSVTATDKDGVAGNTASRTLTVANVAPTAALTVGTPAPYAEGSPITATASATDPSADDTSAGFAYHFVLTKTHGGTTTTLTDTTTRTAGFSFTPDDDGTYTLTVTATDKDGATGPAATQSFTVGNVAPSNVSVSATTPIDENGTTTLTGTFADPGTRDTHTVTVDWGDGSPDTVLNLSAGVTTIPATQHQYLDNRPGNAPYTVGVTVADNAGASATGSTTVEVDDVAPTASLTTTGNPGVEGSAITLTATATDPGTADAAAGYTYAYTVTKTHGGVTTTFATGGTGAGAQSEPISFTPDDDGTYVVTVTATDKDGVTGPAASQTFTVANVAPSNLTVSATSPEAENGTTTLTGTFADPGTRDTHTVTVDWGDGSPDTVLNLSAGVTTIPATQHQYLDNRPGNAPYTIAVTVTDPSNVSTAAQTATTVNNVAPTASLTNVPTTSPEGTAITVTGNAADPGSLDTETYAYTVTRNGVAYAAGTDGPTPNRTDAFTFTPTTNGTYVVSLVVTDKDGAASSTVSSTVNVTDVAPTVALSGSRSDPSNPTPNDAEGSTFTLTLGPVNDPGYPGGERVQNYYINWGDGTATQVVPASAVNQTTGGTVTHVYADGTVPPGTTAPTLTIHVDILDGNGYHPDAGTLGVVVYNLPPTATFAGSGSVSEGSAGNVLFFNPSDPSSVDAAAGYTYSYDFNDDGVFEVANSANPSASVPASYLSTPGTVTVRGRITDKDGGFTDYTHQIVVNNVAPTVNALANVTTGAGTAFTEMGSFSDPGNDAPWQVYANYNYDPTTNPGRGTLVQSSPSKTFTVGTTYPTAGTYTVLVTVVDSLGATGTGTFTVTVAPTGFAVTAFTPTPSGFDVTFNRGLNTAALNLYKGLSNTYGASDLTLTGPAGPVRGSFTYDPATNTGHFVATGGVLPAGSYSASLVGSTSAFQDANGNPLSSNDGTGNYDATFTVAGVGDVVSLPDFARGPGQAVNTPATATTGLPVSIADGTGVTAVDFDVLYNANDLTITGVALPAALQQAGYSVVTNGSTPGDLRVSIFGVTAMPAGLQTILYLNATVPTAATYGQAAALRISGLRINEGAVAGTADEAVEKVAFLGDASGNRGYSGLDATYIANVVVGNATGFDAYPLVDPVIVGDATGDGTLSGQDASLVAQKSIGLSVPQIPDLPAGNTTTTPGTGLDPVVTIGSRTANPGTTVTLPVSISDATGLLSANLTVDFNAAQLQFLSAAVGSVDGNFTLLSNPNNAAGTVSLVLFEAGLPLTGGAGTIANLTFAVPAAAPAGSHPVTLDPAGSNLNEGLLPITPANGAVDVEPATVGSTGTFYNGSAKFDPKTNPALGTTADLAAVATDKSALRPGNTATFANYTSYSLGLNGVVVEFVNLSATTFTAGDFTFRVGNTNDPSTWATAPAPVSVTTLTGPNGHLYADLIWANNAIQNQWLQVTVLADADTRLGSAYTFYYGNAIGEAGNSAADAKVDATDISLTQSHQSGFGAVGVTSAYDFNRDGKVDATDISLAQSHQSGFNPVKLISVPASPAVVPAAATTTTTARPAPVASKLPVAVTLPVAATLPVPVAVAAAAGSTAVDPTAAAAAQLIATGAAVTRTATARPATLSLGSPAGSAGNSFVPFTQPPVTPSAPFSGRTIDGPAVVAFDVLTDGEGDASGRND